MLSAWFIVAWFFLRGADVMRPSALHRAHALGWIFFLTWLLLVAAVAFENNLKIGGGYFMSIYFAGAFVALTLSYLEFFGLQRKDNYAEISSHAGDHNRPSSSNPQQNPGSILSRGQGDDRPESSDRTRKSNDGLEPTETTSLLGESARSTFNRYARQRNADESYHEDSHVPSFVRSRPFGEEQTWSSDLPSWLWAIEFLVFVPFALIFVGQVTLLTTESLHQTLADG